MLDRPTKTEAEADAARREEYEARKAELSAQPVAAPLTNAASETQLESLWNELATDAPTQAPGALTIAPAKELGQGVVRHTMVITDAVVDPAGDIGAGLLTMVCPPKETTGKRGPKVKLENYATILAASRTQAQREGVSSKPPTIRHSLVRLVRELSSSFLEDDAIRRRIHLLVSAAKDWRKAPKPKTPKKASPKK
jgi:hypothetical protein